MSCGEGDFTVISKTADGVEHDDGFGLVAKACCGSFNVSEQPKVTSSTKVATLDDRSEMEAFLVGVREEEGSVLSAIGGSRLVDI